MTTDKPTVGQHMTTDKPTEATSGESCLSDLLERICMDVEPSFEMGGFTGGIYQDFAIEVARRAVLAERKACANAVKGLAKEFNQRGLEGAVLIFDCAKTLRSNAKTKSS